RGGCALGGDEAGHQADDGDVVGAELLGQPGDHAPEGRLGDRVAEAPAALADGGGRLDLPGAGGDVDGDAGALLLPERQAELDELERRVHVAAEHALDELE